MSDHLTRIDGESSLAKGWDKDGETLQMQDGRQWKIVGLDGKSVAAQGLPLGVATLEMSAGGWVLDGDDVPLSQWLKARQERLMAHQNGKTDDEMSARAWLNNHLSHDPTDGVHGVAWFIPEGWRIPVFLSEFRKVVSEHTGNVQRQEEANRQHAENNQNHTKNLNQGDQLNQNWAETQRELKTTITFTSHARALLKLRLNAENIEPKLIDAFIEARDLKEEVKPRDVKHAVPGMPERTLGDRLRVMRRAAGTVATMRDETIMELGGSAISEMMSRFDAEQAVVYDDNREIK